MAPFYRRSTSCWSALRLPMTASPVDSTARAAPLHADVGHRCHLWRRYRCVRHLVDGRHESGLQRSWRRPRRSQVRVADLRVRMGPASTSRTCIPVPPAPMTNRATGPRTPSTSGAPTFDMPRTRRRRSNSSPAWRRRARRRRRWRSMRGSLGLELDVQEHLEPSRRPSRTCTCPVRNGCRTRYRRRHRRHTPPKRNYCIAYRRFRSPRAPPAVQFTAALPPQLPFMTAPAVFGAAAAPVTRPESPPRSTSRGPACPPGRTASPARPP